MLILKILTNYSKILNNSKIVNKIVNPKFLNNYKIVNPQLLLKFLNSKIFNPKLLKFLNSKIFNPKIFNNSKIITINKNY